jgi:hypothetical protein
MKVRTVLVPLVFCVLIAPAAALGAIPPELKYFVEVRVPTLDVAADLAAEGFDIAGIDRKTSMVGVVVTSEELDALGALGWPVTIRATNADLHAVDALADYTDPQELSTFMDQVVAAHPDLAKKITLANVTFEGRHQFALQITNDVGLANDRPSFILDAQHHAREVMTPEIARDLIDYLTSRYATDAQVRNWVDNVNIYVVGSVNPDGGMYVFTNDSLWRKNRHPACPVDNNRNYPTMWGSCNGSSTSCTNDTYRGTSAGSEPETQGLMQLTSDVHPFFTLSYHSYGEYLMYPYGCGDPDERSALDEVAQGLNAILENDAGVTGQYATGPIWSTIYLADGGSVDAQYNLYGAYAYVIEVTSSSFSPSYATWRDVTVARQRTAWKYFLDKTLDGAQIRGTVIDAGTGLPLPAKVLLQEVTFTHNESPRHADAYGHYRLLVHSGETYHVRASADGYCSVTQEVAVGTQPATSDFLLGRPAIPQGVSAVAAGDNAIDVSWQPAQNGDQYRVLRALAPGGPYAVVATVPGAQTSFHDAPVSGTVTYSYVVRAVQGCDSANSAEATASTSGPCTVGPAFAGLASAATASTSTCAINLTWPGAATRCGGSITYSIYRNATAPFSPSPGNLIASGLGGNAFADHDALVGGTGYAYIVRAFDAGNGADDGNELVATAVPTGVNGVGTWTDDAGDSGAARMTTTFPWSVLPSGGKTGPNVYATGTYANGVCAAMTTPSITLQGAPALSFASKYDMETNYDAGIVEVATAPAFGAWTKLALNYPDALSFAGNACGIPTSGAGTVFSRTIASPAYPGASYSGSLATYAGQTVKLRWRFSSDGGITGKGWWVDDIAITNAVIPGTCSAGAAPAPKEPSADGGMTAAKAASGTGVDLTYLPGCGTLDNAVYWGAGPITASPVWTNAACAVGNTGRATFDPGDPLPDTFAYFVIVGQHGPAEGSYGTSTSGERPEAIGIGACDEPQVLGGTCP